MAQIAKTKYSHPEVLVDTKWVEEHLEDTNGGTNVKHFRKSNYYNQSNYKFAFCESCYWFASILKDILKYNQCPRCEKKMYIERIL